LSTADRICGGEKARRKVLTLFSFNNSSKHALRSVIDVVPWVT